jgi:hypothetical protein
VIVTVWRCIRNVSYNSDVAAVGAAPAAGGMSSASVPAKLVAFFSLVAIQTGVALLLCV